MMRSSLRFLFVWMFALVSIATVLPAQKAAAQSHALYSLTLRSVSLNEALAEFSQLTGHGVTFDPEILDAKRATCAISKASADDALNCILEGTGLDYIQLSSGTYVITASSEQASIYGTIAGDVTDIVSGHPLADAHILLASTSTELSTISNSNGQFTLPPLLPGKYYLSTTHLGYRDNIDTLLVIPGKHGFRKITMVESPIVFAPVVIDGMQRKHAKTSLDESYLLLSDSLMLGHLSTSQSIVNQVSAVPGVRINNLTSDAHLQGSGAGEHQFKLDGVPIFLPQRTIGILGPFSPFALESVTVHKTGFSVEEGSYLAGVISAKHKLSKKQGFDLQVDPLSLNARYVGGIALKNERKLELMTSYRTSVWSLYPHQQLQSTLNQWSRPDPFLIFGPIRRYEEIDPSFFEEALSISSIPTTTVSFSDLHVAGKLSLSPFSAINFSGFSGQNNLKGSLSGLFPANSDSLLILGDERALIPSNETSAPLSVSDQYKWRNHAGQINYHTLLGKHSLFNIQARASTYNLDQNYKLVDGLSDIINQTPEFSDSIDLEPVYEFPIRQLEERNDVKEFALESRIEHAFSRHFLSAGVELIRTESTSDILLPSLISENDANNNASALVAGVERIAYATSANRTASFVHDRINLSNNLTADLGLRLTYFFSNNQAFFEPRAAIRYDGQLKNGGTFASRTAAGIYRQYLLQFDVSTLNAGTLFPSKRIWIPVDAPILPPLAYHFSQSFLFAPTDEISFRLEGYTKILQQTYTVNFIPSPTAVPAYNVDIASNVSVEDFIPQAESVNIGGSFSLEWTRGAFYSSLNYDFSSIRRKAPELFENNWTTVPWNEPHRLNFTLQAEVTPGLILSTRFTGVWGRSWGFRQAYYDYFGHRNATRQQPPYDFGNPEDHILPAIYQVDTGIAYSTSIKNSTIQLRFDLINALDRKNIADWRLLWVDGNLEKDSRYLYPRIPSIALRLSL
ncbi:MAG: carboxypeptidase regulatory-like domain-containing protein [Rhodothermales bacterium]